MDGERFKRSGTSSENDREQGERVVASLRDIAPDFVTYLIEFPFGDVYSRPRLDLNHVNSQSSRHSLHWAMPRLNSKSTGAMNVGASRQEVVEVIIQMAVYAGFPATLNGLFAAREVFQEREQPSSTKK